MNNTIEIEEKVMEAWENLAEKLIDVPVATWDIHGNFIEVADVEGINEVCAACAQAGFVVKNFKSSKYGITIWFE